MRSLALLAVSSLLFLAAHVVSNAGDIATAGSSTLMVETLADLLGAS